MVEYTVINQCNDVQQLPIIELNAAKSFHLYYPQSINWPTLTLNDYMNYNHHRMVWCAVLNNDTSLIIGFVVCSMHSGGNNKILHIDEIDVDPQYQRNGISQSLLSSVYNYAKLNHTQYMTLRTFHTTPFSINGYKKFGFSICNDEQYSHVQPFINDEFNIFPEVVNDRCTMHMHVM